MTQVNVRRTVVGEKYSFEIVDGFEEVTKLPGGARDRVWTIRRSALPRDPDAEATFLAIAHKLGGDQWRADMSWDFFDDNGLGLWSFTAFSERGGSANT